MGSVPLDRVSYLHHRTLYFQTGLVKVVLRDVLLLRKHTIRSVPTDIHTIRSISYL